MRNPFLEAKFYETYQFAFCVRNILHDQFSYIRHLDDFYGDGKYLAFTDPFPRFSAFHSFLEFVIGSILTEDTEGVDLKERKRTLWQFTTIPGALGDLKPTVLPVEEALSYHRISFTPFVTWLVEKGTNFPNATEDDIYEYLIDLQLEGPLDDLLFQSVKEVFYVLFGNRQLLLLFNDMMASQVSKAVVSELPHEWAKNYEKDGVLKRTHIPRWVKDAVFFRERGLCAICRTDLTRLMNTLGKAHFS